jgi:hypothetical protein
MTFVQEIIFCAIIIYIAIILLIQENQSIHLRGTICI